MKNQQMSKAQSKLSVRPHLNVLCSMFLIIIVCSIMLVTLRAGALFYFLPGQYKPLGLNQDFWQVLWTGLRFDVATIIRVFIPIYLLSIVAILLPRPVGLAVFNLGRWWGLAIVVSLLLLSVANIGYIAFFGTHFGALTLELMSYDTAIILDSFAGSGGISIYALLAFGMVSASVFCLYVLNNWQQKINQMCSLKFWQVLLIMVLCFLMVISLGRGSFGTFPLSKRHLIVSTTDQFNNLVPNGLLSAYYAYLEYNDSAGFNKADERIGRELFKNFYGYPPFKGDLWPQLFSMTPVSLKLESSPPNVVFNVMESFGSELLRPEFNDMYDWSADLRNHLNTDLVMTRFLPAYSSTQRSLIQLIGNIDYPIITASKYQNISLMTAAAKVFKQSGYKTIFVYTGFEGERNIADYVKRQGFDEFVGASSLKKKYPMMPMNVWGGEDRYMFQYAAEELSNKDKLKTPLFIMTLSINNHPPYIQLDGMTNEHTHLTPILMNKLGTLPPKSMATYEYSNRYLAWFINQIKSSDRRNDTIIAATGDHGVRGLKQTKGSELRDLSVPFYLYIPPVYTPEEKLDLNQIASHKDIFPTLYHLSLSKASYLNFGRNVFLPMKSDDPHAFAKNSRYVVNHNGAISQSNPDVIFPFVSDDDLLITYPRDSLNKNLVTRDRDYRLLMDWVMRKQIVNAQ